MEYLLESLNNTLGDQESARIAFVVLVAVAIAILGVAILLLGFGSFDPMRRRIKGMAGQEDAQGRQGEGLNKVLESASPYVLPKKGKERTRVSTKLIQAGYRGANAPTIFFGVKILLGVLLPIGILLLAGQFPNFTTNQVIVATVVSCLLGLLIPNMVLSHLHERRLKLLRHGFPDALDLLVVCVEAGLGLHAAIQRVADELAVSHPMLADELSVVNGEIRAGQDQVQALRNLAERTGLKDIRGLVSLLAQSLRFGTSVADTLRVYAEEFRDKRMQKAEEAAAKIGPKMIFPLVLFIFPSFFLVMIGPAILGVLEALNQ